MFANSYNISQSDAAKVCPEVFLFESEIFEFEDVVPFNVSVDPPTSFRQGKMDTGSV